MKWCNNCDQYVGPTHTMGARIITILATAVCALIASFILSISGYLGLGIILSPFFGLDSGQFHATKHILDTALAVFIFLTIAIPVAGYYGFTRVCPMCKVDNWDPND